jgi:predicted Fe-S protein YdhL (DUF1289 family)
MAQNGEGKVLSPCIKVCKLNIKGYCVGCFRKIDEITHWSAMTEEDRKVIMEVLPKRKEANHFIRKAK